MKEEIKQLEMNKLLAPTGWGGMNEQEINFWC